jgi:prevent-host-death family protein
MCCSYNGYNEEVAMGAVGVRELKNRLTYYLRRARKGEEVIVTERGRPIAILKSLQQVDRAATLETRLARLAALGIVTLPTRKRFGRARPARIVGSSVSRAILEDRR